ncbi:TonB-dependent siderophore receptor [Acidovorax sp. ACV01]|uniref:TonB-dependent receptor plug domain-containing protein n=1 Tax=Acidovorax sp. ACV01 TaxID=2769311 RepID=UPI00177E71E5|nr:TonB-dependent receptor [Acidovorax sp. ACV01]MBD9395646.1 TonB-dependent receptor [Acidovorax sp. ACV01]
MRKTHTHRVVVWAACLAGGAAWAQASPEGAGAGASSTPQLDGVTVTARRSLEQRFFAAGSLVVVDRADIEQMGAFSVADVLRQLPGVQVVPSADGSVEIRMRGMERGATQLLIDGQRVGSKRTQLPIDQLPPELIERIEVVRAPSAEFSGATGGTLNIVLRQATVKRETVLRLTDNHVWGRNAGQAFFSRTGPLGGAVKPAKGAQGSDGAEEVLEAENREPWSYFVAASATGLLLGSDTHRSTQVGGAEVAQSDTSARYKRTDYALVPRVSGKIGAADQLTLRATLSKADFGGTADSVGSGDGTYAARSHEAHNYDRRYLQAAADWTHRFAASKLETTLSASRASDTVDRRGDLLRNIGVGGAAVTDSYSFVDDRREDVWNLSTKLTGTADALLWSAGAQLEDRKLFVNTTASGDLPVNSGLDAGIRRWVVWGQNEWELPATTTLTLGLRGERVELSGGSSAVTGSKQWNILQPSLHTRTPLSEDLQWRVNLARVTQLPRVWDLVDRAIPSQGSNSLNNPDTIGNPNLRPQVAWTLDTGFERRLATGHAGVNLFVRRMSDVLAPTLQLIGARWVEQRGNVGDAIVWGLEADARTGLGWVGLGSEWTLSANASALQSRMTSGPNEGRRIPGQARYVATLTAAKPMPRNGGWYGGATLSMTGPADQDINGTLTGKNRASATLDLYVGQLVRGLGYWRLGVYNVGDAHFRRDRVDASGAVPVVSTSSMQWTPRAYLTVGTQF